MQPLDDVKVRFAVRPADKIAQREITRPQVRVEVEQIGLGLDHQSVPALQIEPIADVVGHRMTRTDIDVEAGLLAGERAGEMIVLKTLSIGKLHDGHPLNSDR